MKDNKQLTFAERAKLIKKKYKDYEDDPISRVSMDLELSELAKEQEQYKEKMGIGQPLEAGEPVAMKYGGNIKYRNGGPPYNTDGPRVLDPFATPEEQADYMGDVVGATYSKTQIPNNKYEDVGGNPAEFLKTQLIPRPTYSPIPSKGLPISSTPSKMRTNSSNKLAPPMSPEDIHGDLSDKRVGAYNDYELNNMNPDLTGTPKFGFGDPKFNITGSDISSPAAVLEDDPFDITRIGYEGLLGGLGAGIAALRKPDNTTFERATPNLIDSNAQEQLAREAINTSYGNVGKASNETAQSSGQRLGRIGAVEGSRANKLASTLSSIRERNDNINAGILNQTDQFNTSIGNEEVIANEKNQAVVNNAQLQFFDYLGKAYASRAREQTQLEVQNRQNTRMLSAINQGKTILTDSKGKMFYMEDGVRNYI